MTIFPQELESIASLCRLLDTYFQDQNNTIGFELLTITNEDGQPIGTVHTHGHESMAFQPLRD